MVRMTDALKSSRDQARHPIRVVANRTGLSPTLLRAWERRYGVVHPTRSDSGQRLYSDVDIERLSLLKSATDGGRPISHVAEFTLTQLQGLADDDDRARRHGSDDARRERIQAFLERSMQCVHGMDAERLEAELRRALVVLGVDTFTDEFLAPLLRDIGEGWVSGELSPAHEHIATAVVQRVLHWMLDSPPPSPDGPVAIMGTLAGEQHELGALLAAAAAALEGWRVTFLGRDLPPHDMALAARTLDASMVAVSTVHTTDPTRLEAQLDELLDGLPGAVNVFVGGFRARDLPMPFSDGRLHVAQTLAEFREAIRGTLATA